MTGYDAFTQQKPGGEVAVVPRRPQGDAQTRPPAVARRAVPDVDAERLLDGDGRPSPGTPRRR